MVSSAELEAFLRDWFLRDHDLARRHAPNKAVNGLYSKAYWVCAGRARHVLHCGLGHRPDASVRVDALSVLRGRES